MILEKTIPDYIFYNGSVHSVNSNNDIYQAIAVKENKVMALGDNVDILALAEESTTRIDLDGNSLIPGIIDGHNHIWESGLMYDGIIIFGLTNFEELQKSIDKKTKEVGKGVWIQGGSYIESQFSEGVAPDRFVLDTVSPNNPVVLERIFGASAVNSLALEAAGITKDTPDPERGHIVKDPVSGEPTGILEGNAVLLVREVMPGPFGSDDFGAGTGEPSIPVLKESIETAIDKYLEYGITSVTEPGVSLAVCKAYHDLYDENKLKCRVDLMPNWHGFTLLQNEKELNELIDKLQFKSGFGNEWIRYTALKMAIDGGLTSGTALKSWPYKNEDKLRSFKLRLDLDKLDDYVKRAHDNGWNVGIHVMGDIAIDKAVNAIYKAVKANPRRHRHYIIHAYYPTGEVLRKMNEVGIMASVQGSFIYGEADGYDNLLPKDKQESFLPLRSYVDAGVICSLSTDMPCADVNPFWSMYSAITRKGMRGYRLGTRECISTDEALRMMTYNGAILNGEEDYKGSLEPNKVADLAILDRNLISIDTEQIKDITVVATMLDGDIVYKR